MGKHLLKLLLMEFSHNAIIVNAIKCNTNVTLHLHVLDLNKLLYMDTSYFISKTKLLWRNSFTYLQKVNFSLKLIMVLQVN